MNKFVAISVLCVTIIASADAADQFDTIKKRLAEADCYSVRFVSVLSSSVFDTRDSSYGFAQIARDGRYYIVLGNDMYSFDGTSARAYSRTTNQLIVERLDSGRVADKEISFLSRLDEYYVTNRGKKDREYRLIKKRGVTAAGIPDSMTVTLGVDRDRISRIEYLDINEEPISIELLSQQIDSRCADSLFAPAYPDSAETIKL